MCTLKIFFKFYVHEHFPECIYVYHTYAWCPQRLEEGLGPSETWIMVYCELPQAYQKPNPGPLQTGTSALNSWVIFPALRPILKCSLMQIYSPVRFEFIRQPTPFLFNVLKIWEWPFCLPSFLTFSKQILLLSSTSVCIYSHLLMTVPTKWTHFVPKSA